MKEITIRRDRENINQLNFKLVVEDGPTILIGNGEIKKLMLNKMPVKVYAKQGWLKSKEVIIDNTTTEVTLKSEMVKNRVAPGIGGLLIAITLMPKIIWGVSATTKVISIIGLSLILIWIVYAFIIRNDAWILIEKK